MKFFDWFEANPTRGYLTLSAMLLSLALIGWVLGSAQEAAAYNRVTGQNVTVWDAMWIELRVTGDGR